MPGSEVTVERLTAGNGPFVASTLFDLAEVGYEQAEYAISGTARAFAVSDDGLAVVEEAPYTTRFLVYRPTDPATGNGTVWVEWLNVSGGSDAAPDWMFTHTELVRAGAAWVGVSAQQMGVLGGTGLVGMDALGLVTVAPQRYGALAHPGDRFSYDIFTQAGAAVRSGATVLADLAIERVLAIGESQSAFRLTTYVNDVDPAAQAFDGFLVHARGGSAPALHDLDDPGAALQGDPVLFDDDLRVPVLCVEAETDLLTLGYLTARQDDAEHLVVWEIAGTSHADVYTFGAGMMDTGRLPIDELAAAWIPGTELLAGMQVDLPVNAGPQHYVVNAAVASLERWVRDGTRPPASPRLEVVDGAFVTDEHGNVRGGIRTPHVDVPTAVLSGFGNSGHPVAFLSGTTSPLSAATLASLYADRADYLARYAAATDAAVAAGFVLQADADEIVAIATANSPL